MKTAAILCCLFLHYVALAQFAPQAGLAGSTAIAATAPEIIEWASTCSVTRGYIDISNHALGAVTAGDPINATGTPDGSIVCLGDSGVAVLTFSGSIFNGPGADFAVFENGFIDPTNPTVAFLELAFVEVSSDGENYTRFSATSNTPFNTQIPGSGIYMDATLINNLAGKYISMYGTPFDLEELSGTPGLDIDNITHIRLIDVIGDVTTYPSTDNTGKIINDPYPTNFHTGGFDLDAVGAINIHSTSINNFQNNISANIFPNPTTDKITVNITNYFSQPLRLSLTTPTGKTILQKTIHQNATTLKTAKYSAGIYYLTVTDEKGNKWIGKVIKY